MLHLSFGFVFFKRHLLLSKVLGRESWNLNEHQLHNIVNRAVGIGGIGGKAIRQGQFYDHEAVKSKVGVLSTIGFCLIQLTVHQIFLRVNFITFFVQYLLVRHLELDFLRILEGSNLEFFHLLHS